jgi:hypothetical protein
MKRILCYIFGCHWRLCWIGRWEAEPGWIISKRWRLKCAWCGDWSLVPDDNAIVET